MDLNGPEWNRTETEWKWNGTEWNRTETEWNGMETERNGNGMNPEIIIGLDECNFSPSLAGDCVVCALWYPPKQPKVREVRDSKRTTLTQRLKAFEKLCRRGALFAVVPATVQTINEIGVFPARDIAARAAVHELDLILEQKLGQRAGKILVDGAAYKILKDEPRAVHIADGDAHEYVIAAASIIAKVYVDALFHGYESYWPGYGMGSDHGSPSKAHIARLREVGPSPVHRVKYGVRWWKAIMSKGKSRCRCKGQKGQGQGQGGRESNGNRSRVGAETEAGTGAKR